MKLKSITAAIAIGLSSFGWSAASQADCTHTVFDPATGELHIPLVDVPDIFGGVTVYDAYLQLLDSSSGLLFALASATPVTSSADTCASVYTKVTANEVGLILSGLGIEHEFAEDPAGDPVATLQLAGYKAGLFFYGCSQEGCNSLQLYTGFNMSSPPSLTSINEWNRTMRYAKAALDGDGDPTLRYDLNLAGGVAVDAIREFIIDFGNLIPIFIENISFSD